MEFKHRFTFIGTTTKFFLAFLPCEPKHCWVGIFRTCFFHFPPLHSAKTTLVELPELQLLKIKTLLRLKFSGITSSCQCKESKSDYNSISLILVESRGFRGNKKKEKQRSKSNFKTKEPAGLKMKNLPLKRIAFGEKPKAFFSREYFPFFSFLFEI